MSAKINRFTYKGVEVCMTDRWLMDSDWDYLPRDYNRGWCWVIWAHSGGMECRLLMGVKQPLSVWREKIKHTVDKVIRAQPAFSRGTV